MNIETPFEPNSLVSLRDAYAKTIMSVGNAHENVYMLDADLSKSTKTAEFASQYPNRALNIGIAEQNMVGIAAGLSTMGLVPFVNTFAAFLTRRACDQIAISVAYPKLNVKFFGFHGGINLGEDGATQQAVEDIAIMRSIPNIRVYSPIDANDLAWVVNDIMAHEGPTYVRLSRFPSPTLLTEKSKPKNETPAYRVMKPGSDLMVITTGTLTSKLLDAAKVMEEKGLKVQVVAVTRIKPLGGELADIVMNTDAPVAVVEEHSIHGGLADAVSQLLDARAHSHVLHRIGVQDRFGESGHPDALLEAFELAGDPLVKKLSALIS
ncbi:putative Transketolase, C-terminal subunit [Vibrio nigripulchritudo MADA3029]|uniref:transketolase family protein n=1 Tax=Vibrio nigripulchritudo TaxID=28173 RepID=UPI0003B1ACBF|nr:transketolase C-terminal domain-containing protein [Vibrio nigripulchritudo]CCN49489.1 putative Transketolase, C-terminal subunit [Vibrio nigripulchritudo MADA3020]CCN51325.1 putative Transketolase, C-terminal subunit [Vibrio nigripulchritudo MADA3021]CCN59961.1 putative Transketolase, C-terminal subunit [Vibrio nigripulchritudo MADA3029]